MADLLLGKSGNARRHMSNIVMQGAYQLNLSERQSNTCRSAPGLIREIVTPEASANASALGFSTATVIWGTKSASKQVLAIKVASASRVSNAEVSTTYKYY